MPRIALGKTLFEQVSVEPASSFRLFHYAMRTCTKCPHYHYHPEVELTLYLKGHGMRFVGDSIQPYSPGDLCLVGPNLLHTWDPGEEPQVTEAIGVQIHPEMLATVSQLPEFRRLRELPAISARGLFISGTHAVTIARLLIQAAKAPEGSDRRLTAVLLALSAACDPAGHHPLSTTSPTPQTDVFLSRYARVIDALHTQMPQPPTRAAMARLVRLSPPAFSRFFKRFVGKSYVDYINAWRVSLACRQLLQTDLPITQIALDCGFENLSNFNRRFRQYKQTTPRNYRTAVMQGNRTAAVPDAASAISMPPTQPDPGSPGSPRQHTSCPRVATVSA